MSASKAASKPVRAPPQPDLSILYTNLRFLDLNISSDRPDVPTHVLLSRDAGSNQKLRIQYAEWAFYRLFELWDKQFAENTLKPFYPAYEPVQSISLRAALYKRLDQLKSEGALARDVMIRKTMFDDCKGDKYLELLIAFSSAVLRKLATASTVARDSICARMTLTGEPNHSAYPSLLPLSIAHRASLRKVLERKQGLRANYKELHQVLQLKSKELDRKFSAVVERQAFLDENIASEGTVARLAKQLNGHWQGNRDFINVIAQGEEMTLKDQLLDQDFSTQIWPEVEKGSFVTDLSTSHHGLLEQLEGRVKAQDERLQRWKEFKLKLQQDAGSEAGSPVRSTSGLTSPRGKAGAAQERQRAKNLVFSPRKSPRKSELPSRVEEPASPACHLDMSPIVEEQGTTPEKSELNSGTTPKTPTRASPGSPLRHKQPKASPMTAQTLLSKLPETPTAISENSSRSHQESDLTQQGETGQQNVLKAVIEPSQAVIMESESTPRGSISPDPSPERTNGATEEQTMAAAIIAQTLNAEPTPVKPALSLMERTRKSMAFANPMPQSPDNLPALESPWKPNPNGSKLSDPEPLLPSKANLLARTRQSISLASTATKPKTKGSRKSIAARRTSKLYPTNQFETPGKGSPFKKMTPPEELFSPRAGYDSVFRSRPKVASSPTPTPEPEPLQHQQHHIDEDGLSPFASSPLAAKTMEKGYA